VSITIFLGTPDRIVAACDSRARDGSTYHDGVKKIDIDKDTIFGATGIGAIPMAAWKNTSAVPGESAESRALRLVSTMQSSLVAGPYPTTFVYGVCGFRDGQPDAYVVKAGVEPGTTRVAIAQQGSMGAPFALVLGWDDQGDKAALVQRDILPTLHRNPTEAEMTTLARNLVARAAAQSPKVGGATHVAVLDAGGPRWI
jgi:hypothetical protein